MGIAFAPSVVGLTPASKISCQMAGLGCSRLSALIPPNEGVSTGLATEGSGQLTRTEEGGMLGAARQPGQPLTATILAQSRDITIISTHGGAITHVFEETDYKKLSPKQTVGKRYNHLNRGAINYWIRVEPRVDNTRDSQYHRGYFCWDCRREE